MATLEKFWTPKSTRYQIARCRARLRAFRMGARGSAVGLSTRRTRLGAFLAASRVLALDLTRSFAGWTGIIAVAFALARMWAGVVVVATFLSAYQFVV